MFYRQCLVYYFFYLYSFKQSSVNKITRHPNVNYSSFVFKNSTWNKNWGIAKLTQLTDALYYFSRKKLSIKLYNSWN